MSESKTKLVIFLGPPGSGKGTLSQLCAKKLGWLQLSTGSLCRKHIADKTDIGKQIDFFIRSGRLIDDEFIIGMVKDWLNQNEARVCGVILDGFPRTVVQAQALLDFLQKKSHYSDVNIVRLCASDDIIVQRLLMRYTCSNKDCQAVYSMSPASDFLPKQSLTCDGCSSDLVRRSDDRPHAIHERLSAYKMHEQDLIDFYIRRGQQVKSLDVARPLEKIFENFTNLVVEKL